MQVSAKIEFPTRSRLFLVEQVFASPLKEEIVNLFQAHANAPNDWFEDPRYNHEFRGRFIYTGSSEVIGKITEFAQSPKFTSEVSTLLDTDVKFCGLDLWLDKPGYRIAPHYDLAGFDYAVQVYMPYELEYWQMLGTCVYTGTAVQDALFEMHYRPNAGYLIDKTHTIIHGLNHYVPAQYDRRSVYLRYNSL